MTKGSWKEFDQGQIKPMSANFVKESFPLKRDQKVRVIKTRAGKKGKLVTEIHGLKLTSSERKDFLRTLKASCGTGGTVKDKILELQGDQVKDVLEFLQAKGYQPKKSGG